MPSACSPVHIGLLREAIYIKLRTLADGGLALPAMPSLDVERMYFRLPTI